MPITVTGGAHRGVYSSATAMAQLTAVLRAPASAATIRALARLDARNLSVNGLDDLLREARRDIARAPMVIINDLPAGGAPPLPPVPRLAPPPAAAGAAAPRRRRLAPPPPPVGAGAAAAAAAVAAAPVRLAPPARGPTNDRAINELLASLHEVFSANRIAYAIHGSCAPLIHGAVVNPRPGDVDVAIDNDLMRATNAMTRGPFRLVEGDQSKRGEIIIGPVMGHLPSMLMGRGMGMKMGGAGSGGGAASAGPGSSASAAAATMHGPGGAKVVWSYVHANGTPLQLVDAGDFGIPIRSRIAVAGIWVLTADEVLLSLLLRPSRTEHREKDMAAFASLAMGAGQRLSPARKAGIAKAFGQKWGRLLGLLSAPTWDDMLNMIRGGPVHQGGAAAASAAAGNANANASAAAGSAGGSAAAAAPPLPPPIHPTASATPAPPSGHGAPSPTGAP